MHAFRGRMRGAIFFAQRRVQPRALAGRPFSPRVIAARDEPMTRSQSQNWHCVNLYYGKTGASPKDRKAVVVEFVVQ